MVLAGGYERSLEMGHELASLHLGVPVVASTEIWAWLEERLPLEALTPAIFLHQPGFGAVHWTLFNRVTRIADVFLAAAMLLLSLPLLLPAALAVLLSSGTPIFYRQERLGQFGRSFVMVKLRTMRNDAEKWGPEFAAENDPRATPFGGILRRFRIDELPQLWNVLRGDMSLVGPRPERPEFVAQLTEEIPSTPSAWRCRPASPAGPRSTSPTPGRSRTTGASSSSTSTSSASVRSAST